MFILLVQTLLIFSEFEDNNDSIWRYEDLEIWKFENYHLVARMMEVGFEEPTTMEVGSNIPLSTSMISANMFFWQSISFSQGFFFLSLNPKVVFNLWTKNSLSGSLTYSLYLLHCVTSLLQYYAYLETTIGKYAA